MKKLLMSVAISAAATTAMADINDARTMGRAGTGLALGDGYRSAIKNPALLADAKKDDWVGVNMGVSVYVSDRYGAAEAAIDASDEVDDFKAKAQSGSHTAADEDALIAALRAPSRKPIELRGGAQLSVAIPNRYINAAFVASETVRAAAVFAFADGDEAKIRSADATFDKSSLDSYLGVDAIAISEYGLAMSRSAYSGLKDLGVVDFGLTIKQQEIEMRSAQAVVGGDSISDQVDNGVSESHINLDVGAKKSFGNWRAGVVAKNLIEKEVKAHGLSYKVEPQVQAGIGYQTNGRGLSWEVAMDMSEGASYGLMEGSQYLAGSMELRAGKHAQFRLGYRHDLADAVDDVATLGLGLSPFGFINVDIGLMVGKNDTAGVALEVGFAL